MAHDFWKSAGMHLLERDGEGWLAVTPQFLRAYFTRPEVHPLDTSCAAEIALHDALMDDPFRPVADAELASIADTEAADNYRVVLAFRDVLARAGTVEGAYLRLMRQASIAIPPVFVDQMVHVILRNMLDGTNDPMRLRAAELFFREQSATTDEGRIMLADEEIVEMHARTGTETGLGQLLAETGTPMKSVALDVLDEDNAQIYWARSDRFDTVIDFRFEQPAPDAFARVVEAWLEHLLRIEARVEPRPRLDDPDWRWHIGLDRESTRILNTLYEAQNAGARRHGQHRRPLPHAHPRRPPAARSRQGSAHLPRPRHGRQEARQDEAAEPAHQSAAGGGGLRSGVIPAPLASEVLRAEEGRDPINLAFTPTAGSLDAATYFLESCRDSGGGRRPAEAAPQPLTVDACRQQDGGSDEEQGARKHRYTPVGPARAPWRSPSYRCPASDVMPFAGIAFGGVASTASATTTAKAKSSGTSRIRIRQVLRHFTACERRPSEPQMKALARPRLLHPQEQPQKQPNAISGPRTAQRTRKTETYRP